MQAPTSPVQLRRFEASIERTGRLFPTELAAFTNELGPSAILTHWRRDESRANLLAGGGIGWVLSGVLRKYLIRENGQRRIVDLLIPGDFFGLRAGDPRDFLFESAKDDTLTARTTRCRLDALATTNPSLHQFLYDRVYDSVARLEDHILAQGRVTAAEKVKAYLLLMSARLSVERGRSVTLPISRYDIADHLGIAVETVSRAISELRRDGRIKLESPRCLAVARVERLNPQAAVATAHHWRADH